MGCKDPDKSYKKSKPKINKDSQSDEESKETFNFYKNHVIILEEEKNEIANNGKACCIILKS